MAKFQFVMRSGPTPGKVDPLEGSEVSIGRDNSNALPIADAEVSRKHALMELRGSAYVIQDLGSTNGTFINGTRITSPQILNPGDIVSFGENITLLFESVVDPNATMLSSSNPPPTAAGVKKPTPVRPSIPPVTSEPVAATPQPAPVYSGQVPAGPLPAAPAKKTKVGRIVLIIVALIVLCAILACIAILVYIDSDKTGGRWCQWLPFIVRAVGGVCP